MNHLRPPPKSKFTAREPVVEDASEEDDLEEDDDANRTTQSNCSHSVSDRVMKS